MQMLAPQRCCEWKNWTSRIPYSQLLTTSYRPVVADTRKHTEDPVLADTSFASSGDGLCGHVPRDITLHQEPKRSWKRLCLQQSLPPAFFSILTNTLAIFRDTLLARLSAAETSFAVQNPPWLTNWTRFRQLGRPTPPSEVPTPLTGYAAGISLPKHSNHQWRYCSS